MKSKHARLAVTLVFCGLLMFPSLASASLVSRTTNMRTVGTVRFNSPATPARFEGRVRGLNSNTSGNPGSMHRLWACHFNHWNVFISQSTHSASRGNTVTSPWRRPPNFWANLYFRASVNSTHPTQSVRAQSTVEARGFR